MRIFLSKPNSLNEEQRDFCAALAGQLSDRGFDTRTVGDTVLTARAPMLKVQEELQRSSGCIVLGLRQLHIVEARIKEGTPDERGVFDAWGCTPWNHMEAVLAYALKLPMLLVREPGVQPIGVMQSGVLPEYLVLEPPVLHPDWLQSRDFREPFNEWVNSVISGPSSDSR